MKAFFSTIMNLVLGACLLIGGFLIWDQHEKSTNKNIKVVSDPPQNKKAKQFYDYLAKFTKPQRVVVTDLTKRFTADVDEIKKVKVSLDPQAKFYISVDFFTDENDSSAPLVAQIKFFDVATENKIKEENINLD